MKRVAVISMTADELVRQHVGVTVFGNEYETKAISAWGLDAVYEQQLAGAVEKVLGTPGLRVPYSREEFGHVNDLNGPWNAPAFWGPNWGAIAAPTKKLCEQSSLDGVVVVAKRKTNDIFGGTNQSVSGIGLYTRMRVSLLHVMSVVSLMDCKTGKPLATRDLSTSSKPTSGNRPSPALTVSLPDTVTRKPVGQWDADTEARIRGNLTDLPAPAWESTLRSLLGAP